MEYIIYKTALLTLSITSQIGRIAIYGSPVIYWISKA